MNLNIPTIIQTVINDYALPCHGYHGVAHWARVLVNGIKLAERTAAQLEVVRLFAVLHDSQRVSEGSDPGHGPRAAEFASHVRGQLFDLDDDDFQLLYTACYGHTSNRTHPDVTVQTCWDADRLDLGRVGIRPDPHWLSTDFAKRKDVIRWADRRARRGVIPDFVRLEWGIQFD